MDHSDPEILYAGLTPRLRAMVVDAMIYAGVLVATVIVADLPMPGLLSRVFLASLVGFLLLYEPVSVWRWGGTLGHRRANVRIVSDRTGGPPSIFASLVRWLVKGFFGILSFFLLVSTRRHQTLHDLASGTTVQIRDAALPPTGGFHRQRPARDAPAPG